MRRRDFLKLGAGAAALAGCASSSVPAARNRMDLVGQAWAGDPAMRGPFPLLVTPWTKDGALDVAVLVREAEFVNRCGAAGVIWPTAGEVADLVAEGEYEKGLEALAARVAAPDFKARLTAICPGRTSAEALVCVATVNRIAARHGVKMAILARPPDDAKTQAEIEAHYVALAKIVRGPVIIQTYNGKSPEPDVALLVRLAKRFPQCYGYVKEESAKPTVNGRIAALVAAKPAIHTVFSGWGAKAWLYQGRRLGSEGVITQRAGYADLLAYIWNRMETGDPDGTLQDAYSKLLLMYNLGDTFGGSDDQMRGPHLYVLMKRGVFTNTCTRRHSRKDEKTDRKWIVEELHLSDSERAEIDARLAACAPYFVH